jgi:hypothetical protein
VSRGTLVPATSLQFSPTGLLPPLAVLSNTLRLTFVIDIAGPQPRKPKGSRFGLFPFRSPLLWESMFLSLPPVTEMFQFTGFPPVHYVFMCG